MHAHIRAFGLALLYAASSGLAYYATRAAIRAELPGYIRADEYEVSGAVVRRCEAFCGIAKERLAAVSPLACTCTGARWTRLQ